MHLHYYAPPAPLDGFLSRLTKAVTRPVTAPLDVAKHIASDVRSAVQNPVRAATNVVKDTVKAVTHPVETVLSTLPNPLDPLSVPLPSGPFSPAPYVGALKKKTMPLPVFDPLHPTAGAKKLLPFFTPGKRSTAAPSQVVTPAVPPGMSDAPSGGSPSANEPEDSGEEAAPSKGGSLLLPLGLAAAAYFLVSG